MPKLPGFKGRPFLFWTLAPVLVLFMYGMTDLVEDWHSAGTAVVLGLDGLCLLGLLVLYNPLYFCWAGRLFALVIFVVYAAYVGSQLNARVKLPPGSHSSWRWALVGLVVYGAPGLWFALFGRFPTFLERAWERATRGQRRAP